MSPTAVTTAVPRQPEAPREPAPASPPRDLTVDLLRGLSILAVVIGHWLVVVPSYTDGRFDGINALATVPLMQSLTWVFQVMPLFFVAGGVANAASWRKARAGGDRYADWLRTRLVRLVRPSVVMIGTGALVAAGLRFAGFEAELVRTLAWLIVVPVWFLAVYVLVVAAAPALLAAHERFGLRVLVALAGGAIVVDALRIGAGLAAVGYLNFAFVFLFCQQLGFWWFDGRLSADRRTGALLLAGGLSSLWLLTHAGPYPVSLVGVPGEAVANNAPPTITLIALGLAQVGLALVVRPVLLRLLEHRVVLGATLVLNRSAMTILLWHFTALVITAVVALPLGIVPVTTAGTGAWWLVRLAMVAVMAVPLAGLVALFGRAERPAGVSGPEAPDLRPVGTARVLVAAGMLAAAFAMITVNGLSVASGPLGLPVLPLALLGAGSALVGARR